MSNRTYADIDRRLRSAERGATRLRRGVVSDDNPLSVKLGGAETAYVDVPYIGARPNTGDSVVVATSGHDLIVLGGQISGATQWAVPTFNGTATHYEADGQFAPVAYRRDSDGVVHLRGLVKTTSAFNAPFTMFTLPPGFRPVYRQLFGCRATIDGGAESSVRIDVAGNGDVVTTFGAALGLTWASLGQISFYAG